MPEVFKVKNYFVSNTNPPPETRCKVKVEDLKIDNGYHILLDPREHCLVFGDIDHCETTGEVMDILRDIVKTFQINNDEISYTHSKKILNDKEDHGCHWVIHSMTSKMKNIKLIMEYTLQYKYGDRKIDTGIYKKSWFRLPNQTNEIKNNIHTILKGEPIHFLVQYKKNLEKAKYMPPDIPLREEDIKKEEIQVPKNNNESNLEKLSYMIEKIMDIKNDYFESYNEWINLMFIIYNESNGCSEGLKLFDDISSKIKGYNAEDIKKRWYQHKPKSGDKKLTIKSIYKIFYEFYPEEKKNITKVDPQYETDKTRFEQKVFKLNNPINYIIEEDEGYQSVNPKDLNEWAKGKYDPIITTNEDGKSKKTSFVDVWRDDKNKREYDKIDFEPDIESIKDKKIYNLFKGFKSENKQILEIANEETNYFLNHIKRCCVGNTEYEYFKQWIAHIIQKPQTKTGKAIILYSEKKGSGKNSIIEGLIKLFGSDLVGQMNNIDDITKNFNAHLVNKLLIYGDEITAKAKLINDKLKCVITQQSQNLEKKGVDSIKVKDCTNYIFTSNNRDAFRVEDGDRRLFLVHFLEEEMIDKDEFYNYINNKDEMAKLFNYFKNYKITYNIVKDPPPMTEYKNELQMEDKPSYYKYVFLKPEIFSDEKYKTTEIYQLIKDWAKSQHVNSSFTITVCGLFLNNIFGKYKRKSHGNMIYDFEKESTINIKKILYNFDKSYYKYINNFSSSEEPTFDE
jgi:hypothetical protein